MWHYINRFPYIYPVILLEEKEKCNESGHYIVICFKICYPLQTRYKRYYHCIDNRDTTQHWIIITKEGMHVHTVGKIDRDIYRCITGDIVTDEVVITDNQMQHILHRHPEVYKEIINYFSDIIQKPDFIIEDKHENTGLVIKKIKTKKEYAQIVLRICTSYDDPNYKNSIISCWEISEKRLQNYSLQKGLVSI